jgi:hypothetical protein
MTEHVSMEQGTRVLKARMAKCALLHFGKADIRTGTVLEVAGLFRRTGAPPQDAELTEIVLDVLHPRRVRTVAGPTLFYKHEENEQQQFAVDMRTILLNSNVRLREAARQHFVALADKTPSCLSAKTRRQLDYMREIFGLPDADKWQPVALELHDTIEQDFLCQVAGARQSIKERYEDGLRHYIPKLLRPALSVLEDLEFPFMQPSEQEDRIYAEINSLISSPMSLHDACDSYVRRVGTLPLAGRVSFVEFVKSWKDRHGISSTVSQELLNWAVTGPVSQFYACTYFLANAQEIPEGRHEVLADGVLEIMSVDDKKNEDLSRNGWFWRLSQELAQHYMHHFATSAPGAMGEPLAIGSWWLAQRVSEVLCDDLAAASHLRDIALLPEARNSEWAWRLTNPRIVESPASVATSWNLSPWQVAILAVTQEADVDALKSVFTAPQRQALESLILKRLALWCPTNNPDGSKAIYLFETGLRPAVEKLTTLFDQSESTELLLAISRIYDELGNPDSFIEKFKDICSVDDANQLLLANAARILSLRNILPLDPIWEKLTDSKWKKEAFQKLTPIALDLLFLAFASSSHRGGDKWLAGLPHLYAHACEEIEGDAERTELLFVLTVLSCTHSYSVSALERLLSGRRRPQLLRLGREWRTQLLNSTRGESPWVIAKARAVTAAISAAL